MNGPEDVGQESAEVAEWADMPSTEEQLDEDELAADPLEEARDPADDWVGADRYAVPPREQRDGESMDERLSEEVPDIAPEPGQSGGDTERGPE